jgi:hypothetical protein
MQAMKLAFPPVGALDEAAAEEAAELAAADVLVPAVVLVPELELLLPHAASANAAVVSPTATITECVRRKTLTSPEADDRIAGSPSILMSGLP